MAEVVTNTAMLPQSDREAIARYVKSLPNGGRHILDAHLMRIKVSSDVPRLGFRNPVAGIAEWGENDCGETIQRTRLSARVVGDAAD